MPSKTQEIVNDAQRLLKRFYHLLQGGAEHLYLTAPAWIGPSALWSQCETRKLEFDISDHPTRDDTLERWAIWFSNHSYDSKPSIYLEEAIRFSREVLELRPPGHLGRASCLADLVRYLTDRIGAGGRLEDFSEAIQFGQEALEYGLPREERLEVLINLNRCANESLGHTKDQKYIDEAIRSGQELLELFPPSHPHRDFVLANLARHLHSRCDLTGNVDDISESIRLSREVLELHPPGHPYHGFSLANLAKYLSIYGELAQDPSTYPEAYRLSKQSGEAGISGDLEDDLYSLGKELRIHRSSGASDTGVEHFRGLDWDFHIRYVSDSLRLR